MPTTRPRITITETDDVARMLDLAARKWPEAQASRGELLKRLAEQGAAALDVEREARIKRRRAALAEAAGSLAGVYRPNELEELRKDWPE